MFVPNPKDMSHAKPVPDIQRLSLRIRMLTEMGSEDFTWLLVLAVETFAIASQGVLDEQRTDSSRQMVLDRAARDLTTRMDGLIREFLPGLAPEPIQAEGVPDAVEDDCRSRQDFAEDLHILNRSIVGFCNKYGRSKRGWNDDLRALSLLARGFSAKHAGSVQPDLTE
jgi:hypothetical protein